MTSRTTHKPGFEPLALPLSEACAAAGHGRDKGYEKIKAGRWVSYLDGGSRMVTVESIKADQAAQVAVADGQFVRGNYRGQVGSAESASDSARRLETLTP
jgi:hypothetical protein